ncbi:transparent testa 12 protein [Zea mays]|uniref:Protein DETOXIFICATION 16 n=1 Tax=Zea mays TaxID=4577 RepID=B4FTY7_MAIZE|nr:transparent testa 12 protein [Zea mays]ACF85580.1 unknown [Zea mays]ONM06476.1 Protein DETOXIFICATION 16 [Zea mays]|eukprot:NP_001151657.2 transparent testa 12 protein [Zea mays]
MDVPNATVEAEPLLVPRRSTEGGSAAATESKRLLRLAGPLVLSFILRNAVQMVSVMFVGHLGKLPLAGASLASSLANVTGFSLVAGMAGALDTLCGQAFGARRYALLGVYKQRSMLVLALASLPVVLTWVFVEQLLLAIGEDPDIAAEAGAYARWLIPSLAAFVPLTCHMRFLQTQSVVVPVMASSGVTALAHVLLCYTLVYKVGMGSKGAALGAAVSYSVNLAVLALYVRLSSACKATWTGFSTEAFSFSGLREYAKLAVPSAMMVCLEWWSFELLVLLSGFLPNPKLETSVLSICVNTAILLYMVPLGLGTSARCSTIRAEQKIGCGKQKIGARVNLGAFYMVGIPTGLLLAFVFNLNGMGLWLGIVCGSISKLALLLWIALRIDWESEAIKAKDRVLRSSGQT